MARIKLNGLGAIDRRTVAARNLIQWREQLIADLGGDVSSQRMAMIEMATRTKAVVDHIDAYLLSLPTIVNRRKKSLMPVVLQRQQLCDSLARMLNQLGLERTPKKLPSLQEYIVAKDREKIQAKASSDVNGKVS